MRRIGISVGSAVTLMVLTLLYVPHVLAEVPGDRLPPPGCNLRLDAPVENWYDALPLGNGQLGALVWGKGNQLTVKLDRLDIWEEKCNPLFTSSEFTWKTVEKYRDAGNYDRIHEIFDNHYLSEPPTHIAIGKLLLTLPDGLNAEMFELDLGNAEGVVHLGGGQAVRVMASMTEPVILMRLPCKPGKMEFSTFLKWTPRLGYSAPSMGSDTNACWYEQTIPAAAVTYGYNSPDHIPEWKFAVLAKKHTVGDVTLIAITITSSQKDGADPLASAHARVDKALECGYEKLFAAHQSHWREFWRTSAVDIPDSPALKHYYLTRYYLGASSSPGFPAMAALQSIWPAPGQIPLYKNDLHNDLETQVQYQSYQTAGNFAEGGLLFEYLWERLPVFRGYAKKFYETGGAAVPGVMSYGGHPLTGHPQYANLPTYAGWFGWLFYQHWRYTQDREFLATRAYPWCVEIAECFQSLLKEDGKGFLKLALSSSSEVFSNRPRAWMKPNTNQDTDMMRVHFLGLAEMADALGKNGDAIRWRAVAAKLGPNHVDERNVLMWSEDEKAVQSHRHFSSTMSIHPFNLITVEGNDRDRQIIKASMDNYDARGYSQWAGWSLPWMSSIHSRVGEPEKAWKYLDCFVRGYTSRNGFHMNFDLVGLFQKKGNPSLFTIEGNMLANQAIHDMLLQSWAPSIGHGEAGIVRLFPATPWGWHDASFEDLRAEGGFRVSARRAKNATVWFKIVADADGLLRVRDNFGGRTPKWVGLKMEKNGQNFERKMSRGETIEASLDTPQDIPPKPGDSYTPVNGEKKP